MLTPRRTLALLLAALATALVPATALAKHGADDGPGDDRGGDRQEQSDDSSGRGGSDDDSSGRGRGGDDDSDDDSGRGRGGDDGDDGRGNGDRRDRREVRVPGRCSAGSTAKIKVKHDDGRLEVEFEVDQNRNGVTWDVQVRRNGRIAIDTRATTRAPSGSFSVERKITDGPGADRVTGRATSPSGEVCTAATTF